MKQKINFKKNASAIKTETFLVVTNQKSSPDSRYFPDQKHV